MGDNLLNIYNGLKAKNPNMPAYDVFQKDMSDENKRSALYNGLKSKNPDLPDFSTFSRDVGFGGIDDEQQDTHSPVIRDFAPAFNQGMKGLVQGGKFAVGETAGLLSGSQRDYAKAMEQLDDLSKSGYPLSDFDPDKALSGYKDREYNKQLEKYKKDREDWRKGFRDRSGWDYVKHVFDYPERPTSPHDGDLVAAYKYSVGDEVELKRAYNAIGEALKESGGDVETAKKILEKKAKVEHWGDKVSREAGDVLGKFKPTEGFSAWAGALMPQMIGSGVAIGASVSPYTRFLAKPLAMANMAAISASSGGSAMHDAREYGASTGDVWRAGSLAAGIEVVTEKIPMDRYFSGIQNYTRKKLGKEVASRIVENNAAKKELSDLIKKAGKMFPSKLLNKKGALNLAGDVFWEGFSEFLAEGGGAMVPMIYQNPEDYPTLLEILQQGWEGAKGGFFMGGILGGASNTVGHYTNRNRRKDQGRVALAETENGIVEVVGKNGDRYSVLGGDGKVSEVKKDEISDYAVVGFDELDAYAKAQTEENLQRAVESGRKLDFDDSMSVYKSVIGEIGADQANELAGVEDVSGYIENHADEADVLETFFTARAQAIGAATRLFGEKRNKKSGGISIGKDVEGNQVFVLDETNDGSLIEYENGEKKFVPASDVKDVGVLPVEEYAKNFIYSLDITSFAKQTNEGFVVGDNAVWNGKNVKIQRVENGETALVELEDGKIERVPYSELQEVDNDSVQNTEVANNVAVNSDQEGTERVVVDQTEAFEEKHIPVDKNGKPDYNAMIESDPEMFATEWEKRSTPEDTQKRLEVVSENVGKQINALIKKNERLTNFNLIAANEDEIKRLNEYKVKVDRALSERKTIKDDFTQNVEKKHIDSNPEFSTGNEALKSIAEQYENEKQLSIQEESGKPNQNHDQEDIPSVEEQAEIDEAISELKGEKEEYGDDGEILYRKIDNAKEKQVIIKTAKESGNYLKAPNGKETNLTEEQWIQVRTKAFKNWFGDWESNPLEASKILDDNGEPLVVYHGSRSAGFREFEELQPGIYFTDSLEMAKAYANDIRIAYSPWSRNNNAIYTTFLSIRNPIVVDAQGRGWSDLHFVMGDNVFDSAEEIIDYIRENKTGNDGVIVHNVEDGNEKRQQGTVFVTNLPGQIKDAYANGGEFSNLSNDILLRQKDAITEKNIRLNEELKQKINSEFPKNHKVIFEREIASEIDRMEDELSVNINKVRSRNDLPDSVRQRVKNGRFSGLYDAKTGQVYVILDEITDIGDAQATVLHEVLGHKGIRGLFGDKSPEFYRKVLDSIPDKERTKLMESFGDEQLAAEEYVASFAEGYDNPTAWEKIKAIVKEFLKNLGIDLKLSDNDLKYILWKAKNGLKDDDIVIDSVKKIVKDRKVQETLFRRLPKEMERSEKFITKKRSRIDSIREAVVDAAHSVKELTDYLKSKGINIRDFEDAYSESLLSDSKSYHAMNRYQEEVQRPLNESIVEIMKYGKSFKDLCHYVIAKHAPERNALIESKNGLKDGAGMSNEEAFAIVEEFESGIDKADIDNLWERINVATQFTLERQYNDGIISKGLFDYLNGMFEFYVPLKGWEESDGVDYSKSERFSKNSGTGKAVQAKGRSSVADNPFAYIEMAAENAIKQGDQNYVRQCLYNMCVNNPDEDLYTVNKTYYVEIDGEWIAQHERPDEELFINGKAKTELIDTPHKEFIKNTEAKRYDVDVWIGGEKRTITFAQGEKGLDIADAINKARVVRTTRMSNAIGKLTRYIASVNTSKNPEFVVRNFERDFLYAVPAYAIKGGNSLKLMANLPKAFKAINAEFMQRAEKRDTELNRYMDEYLNGGGKTGFVHSLDIDSRKLKAEKEIKRMINSGTKAGKAKAIGKAIGSTMSYLNDMSENSIRFAVFITERQSGKSTKEAALAAKEITVNFNRKGNLTPLLGSYYAFFNASVQGSIHNFIGLGVKWTNRFIVGNALLGAVQMLAAQLSRYFGDDDELGVSDYDRLSDFTRNNNIILPDILRLGKHLGFQNEEGKQYGFMTIPMPQSFRAVSAAGIISDQMLQGNKNVPQGIMEIADNVVANMSPLDLEFYNFSTGKPFMFLARSLPTFMQPFVDIVANKDFADRQIYAEEFMKNWEGKIPESSLGFKNTNSLMVAITKGMNRLANGTTNLNPELQVNEDGGVSRNGLMGWLDWNPAIMEHVIEGLTGGGGRFWNNVYKTVEAGLTGKELDNSDIPFVRTHRTMPYKKTHWEMYFDVRDQVADVDFVAGAYKKAGNYGTHVRVLTKSNQLVNAVSFGIIEKIVNFNRTMANMAKSEKDKERYLEAADQAVLNWAKGYKKDYREIDSLHGLK